MDRWEYTTLTLRISRSKSKVPGFFNRGQMVRQVDPAGEAAMNELGQQGWELVSVSPLEFGTYGGEGDGYAAAFFKRLASGS
ncbi:MAG: DUF4177 domain-containing protein [Verrucomicrobia bacterium]|nr:DUF4177 domain-containing protein [Verrucomicrobiota bacterium]